MKPPIPFQIMPIVSTDIKITIYENVKDEQGREIIDEIRNFLHALGKKYPYIDIETGMELFAPWFERKNKKK